MILKGKYVARRIYTEPELNELCQRYQELLRIRDWDITVKLMPQEEIGNAQAKVRIISWCKTAIVKIPTPETWSRGAIELEQDMRTSLVHELIHVVFAYNDPKYKEDDVLDDLYESAIESIAKAICELEDKTEALLPHAAAPKNLVNKEDVAKSGEGRLA